MHQAIDPTSVPQRTINSGARIPAIGLGTFGSDHVSNASIANAVIGASKIGYRHFDCASVYGNEKEIGAAFQDIIASGIPREELWITSKLWNDKHKPEDVIPSCKKSLTDLRLDYLDLYLIHWPFPNFHPAGCDVTSRSPDSRHYMHERYMETWAELENLVDLGLVRNIGTSNMSIPKLKLMLPDVRIKPAVNEMELHPHFQQRELFDFVVANGIQPVGFCPLGSPGRPERDRTADDTDPLQDPVILEIAAAHGVHPATICIKWAIQNGHIPIPFSTNPRNYHANLQATVSPPLSEPEMHAIQQIDRNCRMVKGHVFLWKDEQTWKDLWDLDGTITPA